ncbi:methyltransferase domain-containing protein [Vallitalea guaymasensis]|uniref:methyltransferase domain-containing protein n=1 Tax=Vallitalea guaymasensis TaxID=1185412 RepID=UPI000DE21487|nr:methyltransferase domain-containing protein [Vallitalea guaymasensis]
MHKQYMDMLICPLCHNELEWHIKEDNKDRIVNADIKCSSCQAEYEIRDEIAVFLTTSLSRNDLWEKTESGLEKYLRENPDVYKKLMNTPENELNGADYWYKASYFEMKKDFITSSRMFESAFQKIYNNDYINGWKAQMDYIVEEIKDNEPIIDIASGKGYLIEKLLKKTKNYIVATDFSPTILVRNKEYYKFKGLYDRLSLIAFDARKTPFRDNSIVTMTSNMGIQNIEQPGEVMREMNRITNREFMCVMQLIDEDDKVHMNFFNEFGSIAYATRANVMETYKKSGWDIKICNSFIADVKPTSEGEIIEGARIDGFPIEDTKIEFCVVKAKK